MATNENKLDQALAARGWRYDPTSEMFFDGERMVPWEEVLDLVPGMTHTELTAYKDAKWGKLSPDQQQNLQADRPAKE
jgi:hypothetical protein